MSPASSSSERPRIYLDNAATSWPKPDRVVEAVTRYLRASGAPAGRSAYREALDAATLVDAARRGIARLFDAESPQQIVFTSNGTDGLNQVLHGLLREGDHVVTSVCEHNSVLRPLAALRQRRGIEVTHVPSDRMGRVSADRLLGEVRPETRLVALIHASNVTGAVQPVAEVGAALRDRSTLFLVDAAQTAGHFPFSVRRLGIDFLAAPGHKGLLGPSGTGVLYLRTGAAEALRTLRQGGTGTASEEEAHPERLPEKFEAGSLNVAGIAGLAAAASFLEERGLDAIRRHEATIVEHLLDRLGALPGITLHGPPVSSERVAVVSLTLDRYDPNDLAAILDATCRVQVRAGLHCAPRMHRQLGTLAVGGTLRISPGPFTTLDELDVAIEQIARIAEGNT